MFTYSPFAPVDLSLHLSFLSKVISRLADWLLHEHLISFVCLLLSSSAFGLFDFFSGSSLSSFGASSSFPGMLSWRPPFLQNWFHKPNPPVLALKLHPTDALRHSRPAFAGYIGFSFSFFFAWKLFSTYFSFHCGHWAFVARIFSHHSLILSFIFPLTGPSKLCQWQPPLLTRQSSFSFILKPKTFSVRSISHRLGRDFLAQLFLHYYFFLGVCSVQQLQWRPTGNTTFLSVSLVKLNQLLPDHRSGFQFGSKSFFYFGVRFPSFSSVATTDQLTSIGHQSGSINQLKQFRLSICFSPPAKG